MESRVKLLENEEAKMKRKIDKVKRDAERVAFAQASQEEKFQRIQAYDKLDNEMQQEKAMKVEKERIKR